MLEGGGQILRNASALAAITRQAIHVTSIRAGRLAVRMCRADPPADATIAAAPMRPLYGLLWAAASYSWLPFTWLQHRVPRLASQ